MWRSTNFWFSGVSKRGGIFYSPGEKAIFFAREIFLVARPNCAQPLCREQPGVVTPFLGGQEEKSPPIYRWCGGRKQTPKGGTRYYIGEEEEGTPSGVKGRTHFPHKFFCVPSTAAQSLSKKGRTQLLRGEHTYLSRRDEEFFRVGEQPYFFAY